VSSGDWLHYCTHAHASMLLPRHGGTCCQPIGKRMLVIRQPAPQAELGGNLLHCCMHAATAWRHMPLAL
jgi:hypothetical protein